MKRRKKENKLKKILKKWRSPGIHRESKIEKEIRFILSEIAIPFVQEWKVAYKQTYKYFDFLIFEKNEYDEIVWRAAIEVHGDFFHAREYFEGIKSKDKLFKIQRKNLRNDATKKRILKEMQVPLFVYWEKEINNNKNEIKKSIKNIIQYFREKIKNQKSIVLSENEIQELNAI